MTTAGRLSHALAAVTAVLGFGACSSSSGTVAPIAVAVADIAGEYGGTVVDNVAGTQTVSTSTLAQHGSSVGGTLVLSSGNEAVAWTIDAAGNIGGSGSLDVGNAKCVFAMNGAFNPSTFQITGSYSAVSGCSGRSGTFSLTQTCTEPATGDRRRRASIPARC